MAIDLPPPPEHLQLPPEVSLEGETAAAITTDDGVVLRALVRAPAGAVRTVVLCHPHPLYGGTMHNAVVVATTKRLAELARVGTVRFNFRGVAGAAGRYDGGRSEILDVVAAVREARGRASAPVALVGYSFGAAVALSAMLRSPDADRLTLIAPPTRLVGVVKALPPRFPSAQIIAAGRDEFADLPETEILTRSLSATLELIPEATHYFLRYRREVAAKVAPFAAPEAFSRGA